MVNCARIVYVSSIDDGSRDPGRSINERGLSEATKMKQRSSSDWDKVVDGRRIY